MRTSVTINIDANVDILHDGWLEVKEGRRAEATLLHCPQAS